MSDPIRDDKAKWVYLDAKTNTLKCDNCGTSKHIQLPMNLTDFVKELDFFRKTHIPCRTENKS